VKWVYCASWHASPRARDEQERAVSEMKREASSRAIRGWEEGTPRVVVARRAGGPEHIIPSPNFFSPKSIRVAPLPPLPGGCELFKPHLFGPVHSTPSS
jgi:hypothetical protein